MGLFIKEGPFLVFYSNVLFVSTITRPAQGMAGPFPISSPQQQSARKPPFPDRMVAPYISDHFLAPFAGVVLSKQKMRKTSPWGKDIEMRRVVFDKHAMRVGASAPLFLKRKMHMHFGYVRRKDGGNPFCRDSRGDGFRCGR
jgi:hypothetical protein